MANNNWRQKYASEVTRSVLEAERLNAMQQPKIRQMTDEEREEIFGKKKESYYKLKVNTYES